MTARVLGRAKFTVTGAFNIVILEKYHKSGGNALLYTSMMDIMKEYPQYEYVEAVQMADTALEVQREMATLGLKPIKRHRVYEVAI